MCLTELAKKDKLWREIAFRICGNKHEADELVQNMYIRRYENDKGQVWNEYYTTMILRSLYLNSKSVKSDIPREIIYKEAEIDKFDPDDCQQVLLNKAKELPFAQRELLELSYDYSLRGIQERFGVNYLYAYRTLKKARETLLFNPRLYNNKRLKYKNMSTEERTEEYYESLDKRSREYKTWMAGKKAGAKKSMGLGDIAEKVIKAVVPSYVIRQITKDDCNCEDRKKWMNENPRKWAQLVGSFFGYREQPIPMEKNQLEDYGDFMEKRKLTIDGSGKAKGGMTSQEVTFVCQLYSVVFRRELWIPTCSTCAGSWKTVLAMVKKLDIVYINSI